MCTISASSEHVQRMVIVNSAPVYISSAIECRLIREVELVQAKCFRAQAPMSSHYTELSAYDYYYQMKLAALFHIHDMFMIA